jgi:hypothetical protein
MGKMKEYWAELEKQYDGTEGMSDRDLEKAMNSRFKKVKGKLVLKKRKK